GGLAAGADDVGGEFADGVVAGVDEHAGPVGAVGFPALLPVVEDGLGAGREGFGAGDAHGVLVGEQEEGFGAGDQRGFVVVVLQGGLQFGDGGGDGGGHGPGVAREREVGAAHGELELDDADAAGGFAGDDGDAEVLFQPGDADVEAGGAGQVHHVEDEDDGAA